MAPAMKTCLLLLCARFCHPFVAPNRIVATTRSEPPSSHATIGAEGERADVPDEPWEWDGEVVEGAHDAEFDSVDDPSDAFVPSPGFMSVASSVASPALAAASSGGGGGGTGGFDPLKNAGIIHRMSKEAEGITEDDLLDMGGDPEFLDDAGDAEEEGGDPDFFDWDGTVDEDAHLD